MLNGSLFQNNSLMKSLYLGFNEISILPANLFSSFSVLRDLILFYNALSQFPFYSPFLRNLLSLDLSHNNISIIAINSTLVNLEYLSLSDNYITQITPRSLSSFKKLRFLYLSNNNISYVDPDTHALWGNISILNMQTNPSVCYAALPLIAEVNH